MTTHRFDAELWPWDARSSSWVFVSLPHDVTDEIDDTFGDASAGFGSIPVEVTIGSTSWTTSIFPSKQESTFVLPLKKAVRVAEGLELGARATIELTVALERP